MKEKEELIHFETQFVLLLLYIESFIGKNIEPKNNAWVLEKRHWTERITREYWKKGIEPKEQRVSIGKNIEPKEQRVSIGKNIELKNNAWVLGMNKLNAVAPLTN